MPRKLLPTITLIPESSFFWDINDYVLTADDVANGLMFLNNGSCLLFVSNLSAMNTVDVIIHAVPDAAGRTNAAGITGNPTYAEGYKITLSTSETRLFGPFRPAWWNQTSTNVGYIHVDISEENVAAYTIYP